MASIGNEGRTVEDLRICGSAASTVAAPCRAKVEALGVDRRRRRGGRPSPVGDSRIGQGRRPGPRPRGPGRRRWRRSATKAGRSRICGSAAGSLDRRRARPRQGRGPGRRPAPPSRRSTLTSWRLEDQPRPSPRPSAARPWPPPVASISGEGRTVEDLQIGRRRPRPCRAEFDALGVALRRRRGSRSSPAGDARIGRSHRPGPRPRRRWRRSANEGRTVEALQIARRRPRSGPRLRRLWRRAGYCIAPDERRSR